MNTPSERLVCLQRGVVVPLAAFNLAIRCEVDGVRLWIDWDGGSERLKVKGPCSAELLAELNRWKPHVLAILKYTADDRHLFDTSLPFPDHGPIYKGSNAA